MRLKLKGSKNKIYGNIFLLHSKSICENRPLTELKTCHAEPSASREIGFASIWGHRQHPCDKADPSKWFQRMIRELQPVHGRVSVRSERQGEIHRPLAIL
jgi:hypothetical protein